VHLNGIAISATALCFEHAVPPIIPALLFLMNRFHLAFLTAVLNLSLLSFCPATGLAQDAVYEPSRFEPTVLANGLLRPMELEVAADGTIFFIELEGHIKAIDSVTRAVRDVGQVKVTTEQENGLIGFALDPHFATNLYAGGWAAGSEFRETAVQIRRTAQAMLPSRGRFGVWIEWRSVFFDRRQYEPV
jgi:glucose/arabinose dehydrogenase